MALTSIKIFPSIGIARVGNSPSWFIGPELPFPAAPPVPSSGKYKDDQCRVLRQAQRFRLWGYFDDGTDRELTVADADPGENGGAIAWTVHLVNKKTGRASGQSPIDPGARTLHGAQDDATFANGTFQGIEVPLGEAHTDRKGRLIVVAGFGKSGSSQTPVSLPSHPPVSDWYDDIADGPVSAQIKVGGTTFKTSQADGGAWVVCAPPRFSPSTYSITSLYDALEQAWANKQALPLPASDASFVEHVYPILKRALDMRRVSAFAFASGGHETLASLIPTAPNQLTAPGPLAALPPRAAVVARLAVDMPLLEDGANAPSELTAIQLKRMQQWAAGTLIDDWPPPVPTVITADGLTRAALEAAVGASLLPGIETGGEGTGVPPLERFAYTERFRLDHGTTEPGDLTELMALPWQTDFMACGGPTSAADAGEASWWPAARPIGIYTASDPDGEAKLWTRGVINNQMDMITSWHKLGFIVDTGAGKPVETERTPACKSAFIITDRSTFSNAEAEALGNTPIEDAFFLVVDGLSLDDLMGQNPTLSLSPPASELSVHVAGSGALLEDPSAPPSQRQRITFGLNVKFSGLADFSAQSRTFTVEASIAGVSASAQFELTKDPHPYMVDGQISWLSHDTRVFKLRKSETFGLGLPTLSGTPVAFIADLVEHLRTLATDASSNVRALATTYFELLPTEGGRAVLEWQPEDTDGTAIFNFALCRVRYRSTATTASNVRVFFRMFQTASTGVEYNASTTYRTGGAGGSKIPLLGVQGGELVTIPFFAHARTASGDLNDQKDPINVVDIPPDATGDERSMYFGCWLDINDPDTKRFPQRPAPKDGPWSSSGLHSIADLVRGRHQCMVSEINFDLDSVAAGVSPAGSDMLAQRNLVIDHSDNPGAPETHRVQHTFAIRPSPTLRNVARAPDELMISWGNLPPGTGATLYLPSVSAAKVIALVDRHFNLDALERVDDHTLRCKTGGVSYVPIPAGGLLDLPGLITLDLPPGVKSGQHFRVIARQVRDGAASPPSRVSISATAPALVAPQGPVRGGRAARRVLGAFQLSVHVKKAHEILPVDVSDLATLERIAATLPVDKRWHAVFTRCIEQLSQRVRGLKLAVQESGADDDGSSERDRIHSEGKVSGVIYDRFGDFAGFWLDSDRGQLRFHSHERSSERLVLEAWRERTSVRVSTARSSPAVPWSIVLLRAHTQ
jgi:hypothetical protein